MLKISGSRNTWSDSITLFDYIWQGDKLTNLYLADELLSEALSTLHHMWCHLIYAVHVWKYSNEVGTLESGQVLATRIKYNVS